MGLFSYSGSDLVVNKWVGQLQLECGCQMSGTFIAKCVITSDMLKKKKALLFGGLPFLIIASQQLMALFLIFWTCKLYLTTI